MRLGMVIEASLCVGCEACTTACRAHNGTPAGILLSRVLEKEEGKFPNVSRVYTPILCFNCADPPCVKACPSKALYKRSDGIVVVDKEKCCGAKACIAACPYDALKFYGEEKSYFGGELTEIEKLYYHKYKLGTVTKCDFCLDRVEEGLQPACVEACSTNCRHFGDLDDPGSGVSQLIRKRGIQPDPEAGTDPSVYYILR